MTNTALYRGIRTDLAGTRWAAVLAGLSRGLIETRQSFTETANVIGHMFPSLMYVVVLLVTRRFPVPGTDFSAATVTLPGLLAMSIIFGWLSAPATIITANREDGTLLRAKAIPHGMLGYLVGKIVVFALTTLLNLMVVLVPGALLVSGLTLDARTWLLLAVVFVVGMASTVPLGVALGSLMKSSMQALLVPLACTLLVCASAVFYPITALPPWLQSLVRALPFYWVGFGARSAMLPANMAAPEISGSWRTIEMFAVLGLWAALGLLLAPIVLRRMARNQSGSALAKVRERIMSKGY